MCENTHLYLSELILTVEIYDIWNFIAIDFNYNSIYKYNEKFDRLPINYLIPNIISNKIRFNHMKGGIV